MITIDEIFALYESEGLAAYRGERVSQLEHACQCALFAERDGAPATLITAALLHDYGHYVHDMDAAGLIRGIHDHHDAIGAAALADTFVPAVTGPIGLHIEAKRYLCAVDPDYLGNLSRGSAFSLSVQGGPHTAEEARAFAKKPFAADAARVRRWDDAAKRPDLAAPGLDHFRPYLAASLKA
jgi:phosphonate degradation associated HDIG domain protein